MLNFFEKIEDKIAFKRAIKEVEEEGIDPSVKSITRVYYTDTINNTKPNNIGDGKKDQVDTKYFKDWRNEEVLEPGVHETNFDDTFNDRLKNNAKAKPVYVEEDEEDNSSTDKKETDDKDSLLDKIDKNNSLARDSQRITDYRSYFASKLKENLQRKSDIDDMTKPDEKASDNQTGKIITEARIIESEQSKQDREDIKDKLDQIIKSLSGKNVETSQTTVVEPVVQVKKSTTKRRTRGKGKRKFDADVITNIDWRD